MLVDFQPKSMPSPMKKSNASASAHFSRETAFGEQVLNCRVDRHSIDSGPDPFQSERLTGLNGIPKLTLSVARPSTQDRPGHIAKISGLRVTRENIEDNQRICVKRTVAPFVRITRLIAARDNRTGRNTARAQNRRINFGPEDF